MPEAPAPVPAALQSWAARGSWREVCGHRVWTIRGGDSGPTLLCLHGFPTSAHDWQRVWPALCAAHRVVLHDHVGFGLSEKPGGYDYHLVNQAERALALWRELGVERGVLVAHDYGTSVATEILARREAGRIDLQIDGLVLSNGSVHIELADLSWPQLVLANPILGPLLARVSSRRFFKWRIRQTLAREIDATELEAMWAGLIYAGGRKRLATVARYIDERRRLWSRWIGALERFDRPALILWGDADPIAVPAIARQLADEMPQARLHWLEGVGHYPMLEDPAPWAAAIAEFVAELAPGSAGPASTPGE